MALLQILVLGILQGITEFLPVSSSGHLVVVQALFQEFTEQEWPAVVSVNVLLHTGTLAAIIVFYWRRILLLFTEDRRVLVLLAIGAIPAVVIGLTLKRLAPHLLESSLLAGFMFLLTGILLIWGSRHEGTCDYRQMSYACALGIGLFQAAAILPGLSRSGWSIAGAMLLGVRRESATTFSFLLAIPTIGGATLLEMRDLASGGQSVPLLLVVIGAAVAFLVGIVSLWTLVRLVERGLLGWFGCWLFPLGVAVILWQLTTQAAL